jgi:two-component sensor histidine kinase
MVPVRQDDPIAAIGAYWSNTRDTTPAEVELLQTVANSAALALANIEGERQRQKAEEASRVQKLFAAELSHRFQNLLTIIDSLARQTLKSTATREGFVDEFSGRLQALARAHRLLIKPDSGAADLLTVIRDQLMIGEDNVQVVCRGPDIALPPDEAFALGMVLHELGTNARKYGALSVPDGKVTIEWTTKTGDTRRGLEISWVEDGGPPVSAPRRAGFGSRLVQSAFRNKGGYARIRFDEAGVRCDMLIPLPQSSGA